MNFEYYSINMIFFLITGSYEITINGKLVFSKFKIQWFPIPKDVSTSLN